MKNFTCFLFLMFGIGNATLNAQQNVVLEALEGCVVDIPANATCLCSTISFTKCSSVLGATLNDDPSTSSGIEYDWSNATSSTLGVGFGATTNTRALVEIGGQCWARYNMDVVNSNLGAYVANTDTGWSGYYNNAASEPAANEGRLYQWSAAMNGSTTERAQGVCPSGWHVPSDCELMYLENTLGMSVAEQQIAAPRTTGTVGLKLAEVGYTMGGSPSTNSSGFSYILSGQRANNGTYNGRGSSSSIKTSTNITGAIVTRFLQTGSTGVERGVGGAFNSGGQQVRCIKD
ncbi:fibrobacter succinogenes major paralogous domain-containing protein [Chryseobacterium sp. GMJ5]|uniref:Fibrobacter succinogenes major paralogous domain-containing protein n=1 Tax=Chryseobacterium gilvum TaxID=2976534 RepID=A0ABT2VU02_9FLAO|nr:fibrobacter succinogenes major paralogous domain-containing protein [Chryseobacterium gilvum]MCU7613477.1 fibrobacter succinogenes major paralogous domain-containing protein [Chryseobacterium gilvum]